MFAGFVQQLPNPVEPLVSVRQPAASSVLIEEDDEALRVRVHGRVTLAHLVRLRQCWRHAPVDRVDALTNPGGLSGSTRTASVSHRAQGRTIALAIVPPQRAHFRIVTNRQVRGNGMALTAAWITSSRELVAQTRARLGETRTLIALNRRLRNPWWGISGSSDSDHEADGAVFQSVLDRLHRGFLFPAPSKVWAGKGTGQTCAVCRHVICADEVENEAVIKGYPVTVRVWVHTRCFTIWRRAT